MNRGLLDCLKLLTDCTKLEKDFFVIAALGIKNSYQVPL